MLRDVWPQNCQKRSVWSARFHLFCCIFSRDSSRWSGKFWWTKSSHLGANLDGSNVARHVPTDLIGSADGSIWSTTNFHNLKKFEVWSVPNSRSTWHARFESFISNSLSICITVSRIVVMILVDCLDSKRSTFKEKVLREGFSSHPRASGFLLEASSL